jgi:hypothetical protein
MTSAEDPAGRDSLLAVAAVALIAMCLVTFAHEALGHGGACLALGGRIQLLTSSLFRCDRASPLIDAAGPLANLLLGLAALILRSRIAVRHAAARLFLVLVTAFSLFWEGGYLVQAMLTRNGDSYFAARDLLGAPSLGWRIGLAAVGVAIYAGAVVVTARALVSLWPDRARARRAARTAWLVALAGATLAALLYQGPNAGRNLHDAVMEIGLAAAPLLLIPGGPRGAPAGEGATAIGLRPALVVLAVVVFGLFAGLQGRGLGG